MQKCNRSPLNIATRYIRNAIFISLFFLNEFPHLKLESLCFRCEQSLSALPTSAATSTPALSTTSSPSPSFSTSATAEPSKLSTPPSRYQLLRDFELGKVRRVSSLRRVQHVGRVQVVKGQKVHQWVKKSKDRVRILYIVFFFSVHLIEMLVSMLQPAD